MLVLLEEIGVLILRELKRIVEKNISWFVNKVVMFVLVEFNMV